MSFIKQKNMCIICIILFCSTISIQDAYSASDFICECVLNIAIDNNLSCENFAAIEQEMLSYTDIENFKKGGLNVAGEDEKPRILALATAMRKYRDRMDGFEYSMRAKNGRTLKSLYLQELGM